jgi:hypothetical protein
LAPRALRAGISRVDDELNFRIRESSLSIRVLRVLGDIGGCRSALGSTDRKIEPAAMVLRRLVSPHPTGACGVGTEPKGHEMLETIAIILVALWLLGLVSSYTMGGFIHALLVLALVVIVVRVIQGRNVLT